MRVPPVVEAQHQRYAPHDIVPVRRLVDEPVAGRRALELRQGADCFGKALYEEPGVFVACPDDGGADLMAVVGLPPVPTRL